MLRNVQLAIFDLLGTVGGKGNTIMAQSIVNVFRHPHVTMNVASLDMGLKKRDHFEAICRRLGLPCSRNAVNSLYHDFLAEHEHALKTKLLPIPGALKTFQVFRERGCKIAYTTNYPRRLTNAFVDRMSMFGIHFDHGVSIDEVSRNREHGDMIRENMRKLHIENPNLVIKVGDTFLDMKEGVSAHVTPIAVLETGSYLTDRTIEYPSNRFHVRELFMHHGAKLVVNSIADLPQYLK
jgi:phosphonoacetaldehyde hydrolase